MTIEKLIFGKAGEAYAAIVRIGTLKHLASQVVPDIECLSKRYCDDPESFLISVEAYLTALKSVREQMK